jgi:hypothetical protein
MTSRPDILDSSLSGTTVILIQRGRKWYQEGRRSAGENALLRHRFLLAKMLEMWRCYHPRPYTCMHMHRRRSSTAICGTGGTAWGCGAKALDTLRLALTWGVRRASGIRWRRGLVPLAFEDTGVRACHQSCRARGLRGLRRKIEYYTARASLRDRLGRGRIVTSHKFPPDGFGDLSHLVGVGLCRVRGVGQE